MAQHNLFFALYLYASSVEKPEIEGFSCTNVMVAQILQSSRGTMGKRGDICCATSKALRKEPDQLDWVPALCGFVPGSPKSSWADDRSLLKWFSA